jgi:acetyl/propionyl-CoA carboxylase alpha subunit
MNTRLQVEHPVTEMITGLDLVELQIRVARGEKLPITQDELRIHGHAMELRVYAEDPLNNFLPSVGKLERYRPAKGLNIRVDDGFVEGMDVPIYYDPMLAKLVTWGQNRAEAIQRMREAIADFEVQGVQTTLPFGRFVMDHPNFISADFDTGFVAKHYTPDKLHEGEKDEAEVAALVALQQHLLEMKQLRRVASTASNWKKRI